MRRVFLSLCLLFVVCSAAAQNNESLVEWSARTERVNDTLYRVLFDVRIASPWHMYDAGPYEGGPFATAVQIESGEAVYPVGPLEELLAPKEVYDEIFETQIGYYEGEARFAQSVVVKKKGAEIAGVVEWMLCNDQNCLPPDEWEFRLPTDGSQQSLSEGEMAELSTPAEGRSLWGAILEAILWGFAALLTPCVFPMVPMTVSYFMKGDGSPARGRSKAALYGLFIVALYTLPIAAIILITRIVGGEAVTADIFNWLATHWIPNVLFFVIFMIFAASFFGAFEIVLPSRLVNRSDAKADRGGITGLFFMAVTLVLVSFSCTGPIVGSVLIKSTAGEIWEPVITMLAFSVAFALPFTLLALFPSLLKNLPKSGGWLNSVKVVLGFIEVALGFKFLSVADQTYHWGLLDREIYLAIWIVVFSLLGFYLLGKLRFAHDSELKHITVTRLALAIASFTFVVYMIPGMWGAPLKGLSGYLPPLTTQDFILGESSSQPVGGASVGGGSVATDESLQPKKYADFLHLPFGLDGFFDYEQGLAYARRVGKPVFLDFTGHGCVNCREMEAKVWSDPSVQQILRDDYVIVALYSDDKTRLPETEWLVTESGKTLKGLGKKNSYLVNKGYDVSAQPAYLLLDGEGQLLVPVRGYDLSVEGYVEFLKSGLEAFYGDKR